MKKRILALLICTLIMLFAGCSRAETSKPVEDKNAFFSKIEGVYFHIRLALDKPFTDVVIHDFIYDCICIHEDGSFWVRYVAPYSESTEAMYLTGVFQTVYNDNDFCYHASISKLSPLLMAEKPSSADLIVNYKPDNTDWWSKFSSNFSAAESICSNDLFYIYPPGTPSARIPVLLNADDNLTADGYIADEGVYDYDGDGKLDDYLLYDNNIGYGYKRISDNNYFNNIENGKWIDYISEAPLIKVYEYNNCGIKTTRYDLSDGSAKMQESKSEASDPLYNVLLGSDIIMTDGNDTYISMEYTNDKNKIKIIAAASNEPDIKKDYYLYHYDELPDYDTLVKDAAKANSELEKTTD